MVLVSKKSYIVLLRPARVHIFLTEFVRGFLPLFRGGACLFYMLVLFSGVTLAGCFYKTCINHLPFIGKYTGSIKYFIECLKQNLYNVLFYKVLTKNPECLTVRHFVALFQS